MIFFLAALLSPIQAEEEYNLVDLQAFIPDIVIELRYATKDNFTGEVLYHFSNCYLIKEAAEQLKNVQKELEPFGLRLKVWDGFRPLSIQWKLWEMAPDERYVSDPRKGGRHTRGTAVDLTLVTNEGNELEMPTSFDDFSEKAHRSFKEGSAEAIKNRDMLQDVMEKHGFIGLESEWWHFDLVGWEQFPPLDIEVSS